MGRQGEGNVVLLELCSAWQTGWVFCHSWRGAPKHLTIHWAQNNPNFLKSEDSSQEGRSKHDMDFHRRKIIKCLSWIFYIKFIKYFERWDNFYIVTGLFLALYQKLLVWNSVDNSSKYSFMPRSFTFTEAASSCFWLLFLRRGLVCQVSFCHLGTWTSQQICKAQQNQVKAEAGGDLWRLYTPNFCWK